MSMRVNVRCCINRLGMCNRITPKNDTYLVARRQFALILSGILTLAAILQGICSADEATKALLTIEHHDSVFYPDELKLIPVMVEMPGELAFRIKEIRTSCHCTQVDLTSHILNPHQAIAIPVSLNAGPFTGEFRTHVWIVGNRESNYADEVIILNVGGHILDPIEWPRDVMGPAIELGHYESGKIPDSYTFVLGHGANPLPWDHLSVSMLSGNECFSISSQPKDGKESIHVAINSGNIYGHIAGSFSIGIHTITGAEIPYRPQRSLRLNIDGPLEPSPSILLLGSMKLGETRQARALLAPRDQTYRVEATGIALSDPERASVSLGPASGEAQTLTLSYIAKQPLGNASGHIDLTTNEGKTLRIPYLVKIIGN